MSSFSEKIKCCRQALGLSQDQLADALSTTKQVISNYELGKRTPKIDVAAKYAKILNVPVEHLTNDSISYCIWERDDLFEDYYNARPSERPHIVFKYGIDPRIASDYQKILEISDFVKEYESPLSPHDKALIFAYHHASYDDQAIIDIVVNKYCPASSHASAEATG